MKIIEKAKYRFQFFIGCIVEVTCIDTVIILENIFWSIKSAAFTYGIKLNMNVKY